jgi:SAM-dependent methyltransferase
LKSDPRPAGPADIWATGEAYERYVGRWSRVVAREFLSWLRIAPDSAWLDVGCGAGALTETILERASPSRVDGVDSSQGFVAHARERVADVRARFHVADARAMPGGAAAYDAAVCGLVLNFVPEPGRAVREMARLTRRGGTVAAYVWDYAARMQLMRHFWNAASALSPAAAALDEGRRFPLCNPGPLAELFRGAGLADVEVRAIDIATDFADFDDYWSPFLGGQGPAPTYAMSCSEEARTALRERLRASLPFAIDGSIPLMARAWAVRGLCP